MNKFMQKNKIYWNRFVEISTDGAKSIIGTNKGIIARIQNVIPNALYAHCCVPIEDLTTRKMPTDFQLPTLQMKYIHT